MLSIALLALETFYEFTVHNVDLNMKDCSFKNF
jgi:hypothetical protein